MPTAQPEQPPHGSVVLLHGPTGTAFQRLHSTGHWHSAVQGMGGHLTWREILSIKGNPLIILHIAPEED